MLYRRRTATGRQQRQHSQQMLTGVTRGCSHCLRTRCIAVVMVILSGQFALKSLDLVDCRLCRRASFVCADSCGNYSEVPRRRPP